MSLDGMTLFSKMVVLVNATTDNLYKRILLHCTVFSPTLGVIRHSTFMYSAGCELLYYCGFNLHL